MSILAAAEPTQAQMLVGSFLLLLIPVAIGLFLILRIYDPRTITGPLRLPPNRPALRLVGAMLVAVAVWVGAQMVLGSFHAAPVAGTTGEPPPAWTIDQLSAADFAYLATVPGILALIAILVLDRLSHRRWPAELGVRLGQIQQGIVQGVIGILLAMPLVAIAAIGSEAIYQQVGYEHPQEHELLKVVGETTNPWLSAALIFGAVVVAPLWEEFLFRGHLQTLIVRWITPARVKSHFETLPSSDASGAPVVQIGPPPLPTGPPPPVVGADHPVPALAVLTLDAPIPGRDEAEPVWVAPSAWRRWVGVLITAGLFSIVHEAWSIPPIFVLSVCLGYAYERTGNIWAPITLHALFNGSSTLLFLYLNQVP